MFKITKYTPEDWPEIWQCIHPVIAAGETYPCDMNMTEDQAKTYWVTTPAATFIIRDRAGNLMGSYHIKANNIGLAAHVCNCGYITSDQYRGKGVASALCQHSQDIARDMGFRAMQYNLVVSTNKIAIQLWQKQGFEIIGTLKDAFHYQKKSFVDAYIMYKLLDSSAP